MTEAEWLACTEPAPMFAYLRTQGTASERKLRLFAVACCRRRWQWLGEKSRRAVEVLERYVDALATADELRVAARGANEDFFDECGTHHPSNAAFFAVRFQNTTPHEIALGVAAEMAEAVGCEAAVSTGISLHGWPPPALPHVDPAVRQACIEAAGKAMAAERAAQCELLREIFHGPRCPVYFRNHWRTGVVLNLASAFYRNAKFEGLPALADALEQAGCTDESILAHCRQSGLHARGCWVVDIVLNKK